MTSKVTVTVLNQINNSKVYYPDARKKFPLNEFVSTNVKLVQFPAIQLKYNQPDIQVAH